MTSDTILLAASDSEEGPCLVSLVRSCLLRWLAAPLPSPRAGHGPTSTGLQQLGDTDRRGAHKQGNCFRGNSSSLTRQPLGLQGNGNLPSHRSGVSLTRERPEAEEWLGHRGSKQLCCRADPGVPRSARTQKTRCPPPPSHARGSTAAAQTGAGQDVKRSTPLTPGPVPTHGFRWASVVGQLPSLSGAGGPQAWGGCIVMPCSPPPGVWSLPGCTSQQGP